MTTEADDGEAVPTKRQYQQRPNLRLQTFTHWDSPHVNANDLAWAGFVNTGRADRVQCVFCERILANWEPEDVPAEEHRKHFPGCPGIRYNWVLPEEDGTSNWQTVASITQTPERRNADLQQQTPAQTVTSPSFSPSLVQADEGSNSQNDVDPSLYMEESSRVASFKAPWPHDKNKLTPKYMAEAGFYYLGFGDTVRCFLCAGKLHQWEPQDDPWEEHRKWNGECPLVKGHSSAPKGASNVENEVSSNITSSHTGSTVSRRPQPKIMQQESSIDPRRDIDTGRLETMMESMNLNITEENESIFPSLTGAGAQYNDDTAVVEHVPVKYGNHSACESTLREPSHTAQSASQGQNPGDGSNEILCLICLDKEKAMAFIPCGHVVCCEDCAYRVSKCPLCRKNIQNRFRIYLT